MKLNKKMSLDEFSEWKEEFLKNKGCPFFCCKRSILDKDCGTKRACGVLTNYQNIEDPWEEECALDLSSQDKTLFVNPTPICSACTGTSCFYYDEKSDFVKCKSICFLINDRAEQSHFEVDRSFEKYLLTLGAFVVPLFGEEIYSRMSDDTDKQLSEKIKEITKS